MKLNLNRNKRYAIPIMTHPGIELIEKTVKASVTDGQTHADAIIALSENTPSDAATVIMDLTVEAEAFGAKLHFSENDVPVLPKGCFTTGTKWKISAFPIPIPPVFSNI